MVISQHGQTVILSEASERAVHIAIAELVRKIAAAHGRKRAA